MAKRVVIAAAVVFAVAAALLFIPWLRQPRTVTASTVTPRALFGVTPVTVPPRGKACVDHVSYDRDSQVAVFGAGAKGKPGPALELTAFADGYRSVTHIPGGYTPTNYALADINPPARSVLGGFCWRNLGTVPVDVYGTIEPRTVSRAQTYLNGAKVAPDLQLAFIARSPRSLGRRLPDIVQHASVFVPGGQATVWIITVLAALGIPAGGLLALKWTLEDDERRATDD